MMWKDLIKIGQGVVINFASFACRAYCQEHAERFWQNKLLGCCAWMFSANLREVTRVMDLVSVFSQGFCWFSVMFFKVQVSPLALFFSSFTGIPPSKIKSHFSQGVYFDCQWGASSGETCQGQMWNWKLPSKWVLAGQVVLKMVTVTRDLWTI